MDSKNLEKSHAEGMARLNDLFELRQELQLSWSNNQRLMATK